MFLFLIVSSLPLLKVAGLFFAFIIILISFISINANSFYKKSYKIYTIISLLFGSIIPIILWNYYSKLQWGNINKRFTGDISLDINHFSNIFYLFYKSLFNSSIIMLDSFIKNAYLSWVLAIVIILFFYLKYSSIKIEKKLFKSYFIIIFLGSLLYLLALYVFYLFENTVHAFSRYSSPYIYGVLLMIYILFINNLNKKLEISSKVFIFIFLLTSIAIITNKLPNLIKIKNEYKNNFFMPTIKKLLLLPTIY